MGPRPCPRLTPLAAAPAAVRVRRRARHSLLPAPPHCSPALHLPAFSFHEGPAFMSSSVHVSCASPVSCVPPSARLCLPQPFSVLFSTLLPPTAPHCAIRFVQFSLRLLYWAGPANRFPSSPPPAQFFLPVPSVPSPQGLPPLYRCLSLPSFCHVALLPLNRSPPVPRFLPSPSSFTFRLLARSDLLLRHCPLFFHVAVLPCRANLRSNRSQHCSRGGQGRERQAVGSAAA